MADRARPSDLLVGRAKYGANAHFAARSPARLGRVAGDLVAEGSKNVMNCSFIAADL